ncbi:MAG: hypothetical protein IT269_05000, partial [Saprospiraceae bacterium]|nr:hypothetical protein [Saprospiraceae bacterium]
SNVLSLEFAGGKVVGIANFFSGMDLFVSHNNGLTFQPMMYPPGIHDKIAVDAGVIYIYQTSGIFASSDAGNSWLQIGTPAPIDPNPNWTSWGDFIVSDDVFMLFSGLFGEKMSISRDRGQTWSFIDLKTAGLPFGDKPLNGLSRVGNYLITASRYGIFLSQDNGLTWTAWNEGLTSRKVQYIAVHNGYLFASTQGGGIWKRSLSELGMQTVSGKVYFDANNNQTLDAGEPLQSGVIVKSLTSGTYGQTRSNGTYELLSNLAQEDITAVPPKNYWAVTPPSVTTGVPGTGIDFALSLNPDARDVSVRVVNAAPLRPGFVTRYFLDWKNDVPMPAENVEVTLEYPMDMLDVADVSQQPVSQAPGKLVWQPGAVSADASGSFWIDFLTLSSIPLGTEVCLHASITALGNDIAPADNIYIRCDNVVGAFDPNDKQAEPAGYLTLNQLADKTPVVYTVRFQNTGNYPATIVRILDSLQTGFDPGTFRVLASSHPYTWSMRGLGIIEFSFNNIQLPPQSLDEPGSHGFIQYSVAPVEQLPLGMPLRNTAHIFFDYNAPVSTNTTSTLAGLVNTVEHVASSLVMTVMPNPACSLVRFEVNDSNGQFFVYNSHGQLVLQQPNTTGSVVMGVEYLPSGAYRVAYQAENGNIITVALIIP